MAGMLDQLAYEEPSQRLPFHPGGRRDEVNLMAGSVNTMADNKSRFIDWWKSSMRETVACEDLIKSMENPTADPAGKMPKESSGRHYRLAANCSSSNIGNCMT